MLFSSVFAGISLAYYIILLSFDIDKIFVHIWLLISLFFIILARLSYKYKNKSKSIPLSLIVSLYTITFVGIFIFIVNSFFIYVNSKTDKEKGLDYLIVVSNSLPKNDSINLTLKYKLDYAFNYLNENENVQLIFSGGITYMDKNNIDNLTEAKLMRSYFIKKGIARERIILEESGRNIRENIFNSLSLVDELILDEKNNKKINLLGFRFINAENKPKRVGILTSDYNVFRTKLILNNINRKETYILSANSDKINLLNMYLKECLIILKEKFMGYI